MYALPLRKSLSLLMLAAAVCASSARADSILVDTGTPNGSRWSDLFDRQGWAIRFDLSDAETITRINGYFRNDAFNLGLPPPLNNFKFEPDAGTINVDIIQGSLPSGISLYSGSFAISDTQSPAWLGVTGVNTTLSAGTYWIKFTTEDAGIAILGNAPGHLASQFVDENNQWYTPSDPKYYGLQIYGNPAPVTPPTSVPDTGSTAILCALGLASLLAFGGRRKLAT